MTVFVFPDIEQVRTTFCACEVDPLEVYKATELSPSWQQSFREKRAKDPGYTKIVTLVEYLTRTGHI